MKKRTLGRLAALILAVALLAGTLAGCSHEIDYSRADVIPSDAWYVTDEAGVLSADTKAWLAALGDDLYHNVEECDLVVVTVGFTGNKSTEDFAYDLFNDWQIGNEGTNRGVLLLLVVGAEDYWCVQGAGLETRLPTSSISRILNQYLEPVIDKPLAMDSVCLFCQADRALPFRLTTRFALARTGNA